MNQNRARNAFARVTTVAAATAAAPAPATAPIIYKYPNPNPALPATYCPPINLTDTSGFSLFRKLIISCVKPTETSQASYTKNMLQKCREPSDETQMIDEYRDYPANPHGDERLINLIETQNDVPNALKLVAPIQFRTLFEIPVEILNSALFVKPGTTAANTTLIMTQIADSLNTTNFGCKKGEARVRPPPSACANMDIPDVLEIYTQFVAANDQKPLDLLLPLADRPVDPNNSAQKRQVKCNTGIRTACALTTSKKLSDRPFYIAINLFNSSTKSASHTAAIIVYKRELYSIGLSNWASGSQVLSHFRTKLDAKISSPENYDNSILYAVQQKDETHPARIAVQNYQIIDIGFVTTDMIDKLDGYFKDMFQITAIPDFSLTPVKKKTGLSTIYAIKWDPELQATPSDLAYSRINTCYYNYLPIDPILLRDPQIAAIAVALPSAAIGAVAAPLLGQDMTTGAASGAATGAATGAALALTSTPDFISKSAEPPRKRVDANRYIKSTNCSGFIEKIFGVTCSKVLSRGSTGVGLAGQVSAPTTCWLRISNAVLQQIISAVIADSVTAFETALKGKSKFFNAALSGGKKKYTKTRKISRKNIKQKMRKTRKTRKPRKI